MTSRNYYPVNAVAATLLCSIAAGNRTVAFATATELVASDEEELLLKLLTLAWLLAPAATHDPDCEKSRCSAFLSQDAQAFLSALLREPFVFPALPTISPVGPPSYELPGTTPCVPQGWTAGHAAVLWRAVRHSYQAGNGRRVTRLLAPFLEADTETVSAFLHALEAPTQLIELFEDTVFAPLAYRALMHAAASYGVVAAPPGKKFRIPSAGRGARSFSVSAEALGEWGVRAAPVEQLLGKPLFVAQNPSRFWSAFLKKHGADSLLEFPSDDMCEAFYSEGFPDDIPDEWSAVERAKSHGITPVGERSPWVAAFLLCFS